MLNQAILISFVFRANAFQSITGFSGAIIAIILGTQFFPIDYIVVSLALINTILIGCIIARHYMHIDHTELWKHISSFTFIRRLADSQSSAAFIILTKRRRRHSARLF